MCLLGHRGLVCGGECEGVGLIIGEKVKHSPTTTGLSLDHYFLLNRLAVLDNHNGVAVLENLCDPPTKVAC